MSFIKKLAGQASIYGFGHILSKVFYFLLMIIYLSRKFEDGTEFNAYLVFYSYSVLLIVFLSFRMDTALFRFGSEDGQLDKSYTTALIPFILSSLLIVSIGFVFSDSIAAWVHYPDRPYYVFWFSIIVALEVLMLLPYARFRLEGKPKIFMAFKIFNILLNLFFVFLFLEIIPSFYESILRQNFSFIQSDIDFVFLANMISSAIIFVVIFLFVGNLEWIFDLSLWKKMLIYAWPLVIVGIAGVINTFLSVPIQNAFLSGTLEENQLLSSQYGNAIKIPALLGMFTTAFNYAAEPFFFKNASKSEFKNQYGPICLAFTMAMGIAVLGLNFYMDIVKYILGSSYHEALFVVPIVSMSYLFLGIYYNVSIWYKLSDNTKYGAFISIVGSLITLVGSMLLLPIFGIISSAWIAMLTYAVMVILAYQLGQKFYKIEYPIARIGQQIGLIVLALMVSMLLTKNMDTMAKLLTNSALLVIHIALVYKLESKFLKSIIRS